MSLLSEYLRLYSAVCVLMMCCFETGVVFLRLLENTQ
jgi:hypothetical protein